MTRLVVCSRGLQITLRFTLAALALLVAGCAGPGMKPGPQLQGSAPVPNAPPLRAPSAPVSVIDGTAWTPAIANGDVEVVRTADNRLLVRVEANAAIQRSDAALQARFSDFMESMVVALSSHPSVQVRVVGYSGATGKTFASAKQPLTWARSVLRFMALRGVGAERLTARAGSQGDPPLASGVLDAAQSRRIEVLLSDPLG
jgi:outer membrane protein OmpA-like peptidoglycan-associated protein